MGRRLRNYIMVEFQITIAVLILLVICIVPIVRNAKNRARTKLCISNLKQTAMGFAFYTEINMDYMPYSSKSSYKKPWTTLMISTDGVKMLTPKNVQCPVMRKKKDPTWWHHQPDYGVNDYLLSSSGNGSADTTGKLPHLSNPSDKILVTDSWKNMKDGTPQTDSGWYYWDRTFMLNYRNQQEGRPAARHRGNTLNAAFADTHVRTIQIPDQFYPESSPYFNYASLTGRSAIRWEQEQANDEDED